MVAKCSNHSINPFHSNVSSIIVSSKLGTRCAFNIITENSITFSGNFHLDHKVLKWVIKVIYSENLTGSVNLKNELVDLWSSLGFRSFFSLSFPPFFFIKVGEKIIWPAALECDMSNFEFCISFEKTWTEVSHNAFFRNLLRNGFYHFH